MTTTSRQRAGIAGLVFSAAGLVFTLGNEGFVPVAYQPLPGDRWTIGYGTTDGVVPGDKITEPQARDLARREITVFEGSVKRCVHVPLFQYEYDVYVDFAYNVGAANFCSSTMVTKLNHQDYDGACAQFPRWFKFQGKDCRVRANKCHGLVDRRNAAMERCYGH